MKQQTRLLVRFCVCFACLSIFPLILSSQPLVIVGPANGQNTATTYPTPYGGARETMRAQYLYTAGELIAAHATEGFISGVAFTVTSDNGVGTLDNYKIRLANTLADSLKPGGWEAPGSLVYDTTAFQPVNGGNLHVLQTPFHWDGTSNLLVEICHSSNNITGQGATANASVQWTSGLSFNCSRTFAKDDYTGVCGTADTAEAGDIHTRPVLTLKFSCLPPTFIGVLSTTSSTATLDWGVLGGSGGVLYNFEVGNSGFVPGTNHYVYAGNTAATMTTVTALDPSKNYEGYVRTSCGGGVFSPWVGPVGFSTPPGCGQFFYDSGGDSTNYANNLNTSATICPSDSLGVVSLGFSTFKVEIGDTLRIYNGINNQAPLLGEYTGTTVPGPFTATNATGCLTAEFKSDSTGNGPGWAAKIICAPPDSCFDAAGLNLSNLTIHTANFDWVPTFNADSYEWKFTTVNGIVLASGDTTGTSLSFDSLTEATFYKFYIKTLCTTGDSSSWVVVNFNTPLECNHIPQISCGTGTSGSVFSNSGGIYDFNICGLTHTAGRERIFRYSAPNTRKYTFTVTYASSSNNFVPYFYKDVTLGCGPDDWKCIGEFNKPDSVQFGPLVAGHDYFILFDPVSTDPIVQIFKISGCKPTNDNPWQAIPLTLGDGCDGNVYSNEGATFSGALGEPNPDTVSTDGFPGRWLTAANRTVWFSFKAPTSGTVTITTDNYPNGSNHDTQIALYDVVDPNDFSTFKLLESDEDNGINGAGENAVISYTGLTPGQNYYVQVDGFGINFGTFCIQAFDGAPRTLASACSDLGTTAYFVPNVDGTAPNGDRWYGIYSTPDILDLGQVVAAVKPGPQLLDTVFCQVNISTNIPIATNGVPYMPAYYNFQFKKTPATPVRTRLFFYNNEFDDLKAVANQPAATIEDLNISYYNGINQDCNQSNNIDAAGDTTLITDVAAVQMDGTFYLEFDLPGAGEVAAHLGNKALPLTLKTFYGTVQKTSNLLEWITLSEKNVRWHIIERSPDAINWTEIGRKPGQALSLTARQYQLEDLQPMAKAYYRLHMVDNDDQETYSNSVYLVRREQFGINRIFPNPVTDQVTVQFTTDSEEDVVIRVVDCMGRFVTEQAISPNKGANSTRLGFNNLAGGLYTITIASGTAMSDPVRIVVQR